MVANQKDGASDVTPIYAEMDLLTGKMIKVNEIPKDHIKNSYYANTAMFWWQNNSFYYSIY